MAYCEKDKKDHLHRGSGVFGFGPINTVHASCYKTWPVLRKKQLFMIEKQFKHGLNLAVSCEGGLLPQHVLHLVYGLLLGL